MISPADPEMGWVLLELAAAPVKLLIKVSDFPVAIVRLAFTLIWADPD